MTTLAVLACVLQILGRPPESLPPIMLISQIPPSVSYNAEAFVTHDPDRIYLITTTQVYRDAERAHCSLQSNAIKKLVSIVVHEEWHLRHGSDEAGAYQAQLMALFRLGAIPGTTLYEGVQRSMIERLRRPVNVSLRIAQSQR